MHQSVFLAFLLPLLVLGSPWPQAGGTVRFTTNCNETTTTTYRFPRYNSTTTVTVSGTASTVSITSTTSPSWNSTTSTTSTTSFNTTTSTTSTSSSSPTGSPVRSVPSAPFQVAAFRQGSAVDLSPINARNFSFYAGGRTASYCPPTQPLSRCPPGEDTVFRDLASLYVVVAGGQQVYVCPDGRFGYTRPHSAFIPAVCQLGGFTYTKQDGDAFGILSTQAFGARGLMTCPVTNSANGTDWQLFAAVPNAQVPSGDSDDCRLILGITYDYAEEDDTNAPAWEYV